MTTDPIFIMFAVVTQFPIYFTSVAKIKIKLIVFVISTLTDFHIDIQSVVR